MIRSALFHSVRCASRSSSISPARRVAPCLSASLKPSVAPSNRLGTRYYAAAAGLQEEEVQGRIMDLLKNFDKVCMRSRDLQHSLRTDGHLLIGQGHYQVDKAVDYILKQPDESIALLKSPEMDTQCHKASPAICISLEGKLTRVKRAG
ncbi:MAG: mitochondrial acyl carrier protein [Ramalina farinacea]|uniref:Mitochondrial acyl carrier protein n=1 Tax=Ramalina farinacea TaxID=258253 RepID=A0AA43TRL6_9LECA|nr:mitochondrial acyl carrier protein [Ramalina farinacea]